MKILLFAAAPLAALLLAPAAHADPGAAISVFGQTVGVGDATATSSSTQFNVAIAFNGGTADANGSINEFNGEPAHGFGNVVIANGEDAEAEVVDGDFNFVVANGAGSEAEIYNGSGNIVFGHEASAAVDGLSTGANLNVVANLCKGTTVTVTAQSAQIRVSPTAGGC